MPPELQFCQREAFKRLLHNLVILCDPEVSSVFNGSRAASKGRTWDSANFLFEFQFRDCNNTNEREAGTSFEFNNFKSQTKGLGWERRKQKLWSLPQISLCTAASPRFMTGRWCCWSCSPPFKPQQERKASRSLPAHCCFTQIALRQVLLAKSCPAYSQKPSPW